MEHDGGRWARGGQERCVVASVAWGGGGGECAIEHHKVLRTGTSTCYAPWRPREPEDTGRRCADYRTVLVVVAVPAICSAPAATATMCRMRTRRRGPTYSTHIKHCGIVTGTLQSTQMQYGILDTPTRPCGDRTSRVQALSVQYSIQYPISGRRASSSLYSTLNQGRETVPPRRPPCSRRSSIKIECMKLSPFRPPRRGKQASQPGRNSTTRPACVIYTRPSHAR